MLTCTYARFVLILFLFLPCGSLSSLCVAQDTPRAAPEQGTPIKVEVTGKLLAVNDAIEIPRGLMGLHADAGLTVERATDWGVDGFRAIDHVPGSRMVAVGKNHTLQAPFKDMAVVVDCMGDRYYSALNFLKDPGFTNYFAKIGSNYAQRCKELKWKGHAEFWNEPYLNWAERSRANYDPQFYDQTKAEDGGPVTIKGWSGPLKHLKWRRLWAQDSKGNIDYLTPVPDGAKPGDTFRYRHRLYFKPYEEQTYTVVEKWNVYDPTAPSFWSGKQNFDFYMWMFTPWAMAIKRTNPEVQVVAGWDYPVYCDNWQVWEILYKPTIDAGIQWIDGICEHHYGSNSRADAGSYEVIAGYAMARYGKRIRCYNTETAGCQDPAVPGSMHGQATPYGAYNFGLREVVEMWYRCPDKAVARASHGSLTPGWGGGGDEFFFKILKDVRGRLIETRCEDLDVWPVAATDGTNFTLVMFNDHYRSQPVDLLVFAPAGTAFRSGRKVWVEASEAKGPLAFHEEPFPADNGWLRVNLTLPVRSGVKIVMPLTGIPPARTERVRRQFFAPDFLQSVKPGQPLYTWIKVDPARVRRADRACLKLVLEGVRRGEATVFVNGNKVTIPDHDWITEVPINPRWLRSRTELRFDTRGDGYRVDAASAVIEYNLP
jgi:hypothetical protein